jgi:4-hydroxy-tetrahydrodipicolinate synthase
MAATAWFGRLLTAMVTPFDAQGALDLERAAELADYLVTSQASDGLIVMGTTGESPTINRPERMDLFRAVHDAVGGRVPLVANVGDNCTEDSVAFAAQVAALGYTAVMAVTPYYNKPPQEGLYRHFSAIAAAVDVPVVLYNVPSRCVVTIAPKTIIRLAHDVENIVAVKQALGDLEQCDEIAAGVPDGFALYSGDDAATLPLMAHGAVGVISVASHVVGPAMKRMIEAFLAEDRALAKRYEELLIPLDEALFMTANPIMVKKALEIQGFPVGGVRLPLIEPTDGQTAELAKVMDETFAGLAKLEAS